MKVSGARTMVQKDVVKHELIGRYVLTVKENRKGSSSFLVLTDVNLRIPPITIHFMTDRLYSVSFLNNEFFEIPDTLLMDVLRSLLEGRYEVKTSWFKKRKSIQIRVHDKSILPERVYESTGVQYDGLPRAFDLKR